MFFYICILLACFTTYIVRDLTLSVNGIFLLYGSFETWLEEGLVVFIEFPSMISEFLTRYDSETKVAF
jgi:hypothetical protein